jgi:hypothetical protein
MRYDITIQHQPDPRFDAVADGLGMLVAGGGVGFRLMLKQVVADTIQKAVLERFRAREDKPKDVQLYNRRSTEDFETFAAENQALFTQLQALEQQRDAAPDAATAVRLQHEINDLAQRLNARETQRSEDSAMVQDGQVTVDGEQLTQRRTLSSNRRLFTLRTLHIYDLLAGDAALQAFDDNGDLGIGLGNLPELETPPDGRTPSYTEVVKGRRTRSKFTVMWRHLEFGTGVYGTFPGVGPRGGWFYGELGRGLHIKGAEGIHAFRQATGRPYQSDALMFEYQLTIRLTRALQGL